MNSRFTTNTTRESGFTIVELLIVIVVIGILAAITLVAFGGVRDRANTSSAQNAANQAVKKAEIFKSLSATSVYPTVTAFNSKAAATNPVESQLEGLTVQAGAPNDTNGKTIVQYNTCTTPTTVSAFRVGYYDFSAGSVVFITGGGSGCTAWTTS